MLCLIENQPMRRIARKLTDALRFEGGAIAADLGLAAATPLSVLEEIVLDGAAGWTAAGERWLADASPAR